MTSNKRWLAIVLAFIAALIGSLHSDWAGYTAGLITLLLITIREWKKKWPPG